MSFQINQLKEEFQQNGYVVVPDFLDSNELRTVQKNIERLIRITHQKRNYEHAFYANEHDKNLLKQLYRIELESKAIVADSHIPNGPFKVAGLPKYSYDPDKARQLLKEANFDSSVEFDMVYYYSDQLTVDLMTAIQAYLADVGVKMNFRQLQGDINAQL